MLKHKLTLSIDKKIITQAKKQQINLSSFLEIRLSEYLSECKNTDAAGFEPAITGLEGQNDWPDYTLLDKNVV